MLRGGEFSHPHKFALNFENNGKKINGTNGRKQNNNLMLLLPEKEKKSQIHYIKFITIVGFWMEVFFM